MTIEHWTEDRLLGGRLLVHQPADGYRIAVDPILLAAAVDAAPGARVLDLGAGVGGASLCLAWRRPDLGLTGLECEPVLAACLATNAERNGLAERLRVVVGDTSRAPFPPAAFDAVMTNPPYLAAGRATSPMTALGRRARHEGDNTLRQWIDAACGLVRPGGRVVVVHRADRLGELAAAFARWAHGLDVLPLWPKAGRPARRVLVGAFVGGRRPSRLLPGLVLHRPDGHLTAGADRILRDGAALRWEQA